MTEIASQMHLAAAGAVEQRPCKECGILFTPRRSWAEFCKTKCRNDFHAREARKEAIRAVAPEMYQALLAIADRTDDEVVRQIASSAIRDLKAP